jgi:antagonist of KipI
MAISIIKAGILDSIQDLGRPGYGRWGINPGGAMDRFAASVANMLVGNGTNEGTVEIHFPGPQLLFEQNAMIALTGGNFTPTLNEIPVPLWTPIVMRKNTVLHFPRYSWGARCYLAVHGGLCIEKWLGSYSTHLKAEAGGWHGQALKKGDELSLKESNIYFAGFLREDRDIRILPWATDSQDTYRDLQNIAVIPGWEWACVAPARQKAFLDTAFTILPTSDRMGYQIRGAEMELNEDLELLSSGVGPGTIQLLPGGKLIVLMADHQTTGGYPRIAHAISADLPKLAQLRPGGQIRFRLTSLQDAEQRLFSRHKLLRIVHRSCLDRLNAQVC